LRAFCRALLDPVPMTKDNKYRRGGVDGGGRVGVDRRDQHGTLTITRLRVRAQDGIGRRVPHRSRRVPGLSSLLLGRLAEAVVRLPLCLLRSLLTSVGGLGSYSTHLHCFPGQLPSVLGAA
jgi:hypothetical protein